MHLTRTGWHFLAAVYLVPAVLIGMGGNTVSTGTASEVYYWGALVCGLLAAYAVISMFAGGETMTRRDAMKAKIDREDDVVSFDNLHGLEYIFDGALFVVAIAMFFACHKINSNSTGLLSLASMIWSWFSLAAAALSGWQFWRLKSGQIVQVTRKLVEN